MENDFRFLIYKTEEEEVVVNAVVKDESVWLTQKGMAELFAVEVPAISKHLANIYAEGELTQIATVSKMEIVQSPTAHACANAKSPADQGIWGIFEVFVDTVVLCTVTALVILVSYDQVNPFGGDGVMMTVRAYSLVLGDWAGVFFAAAILSFGYATILCWSHYGAESLRFLTSKKRYRYLYLGAVTVCVFVGCIIAPESVWTVADFSIAALTFINLITLLLLRGEIKEETKRWAKNTTDR